jgi:hypothetical protein
MDLQRAKCRSTQRQRCGSCHGQPIAPVVQLYLYLLDIIIIIITLVANPETPPHPPPHQTQRLVCDAAVVVVVAAAAAAVVVDIQIETDRGAAFVDPAADAHHLACTSQPPIADQIAKRRALRPQAHTTKEGVLNSCAASQHQHQHHRSLYLHLPPEQLQQQ